MNFHLTDSFQKKAKKLCKKDSQLKLALTRQFSISKKLSASVIKAAQAKR